MSTVRISVVIATYNRRNLLLQTLDSLFAQRFPATDYEIIVVVDGSSDGTAESLRALTPRCALRFLEQANRGQASARNSALRIARGDLVLFLDDDTICEPSLLSCHAAAQSGRQRMVVFGPVLLSPESPRTIATEWVRRTTADYVNRLATQEPRWPTDLLVDANSSAPKSVLLECGGFDERFKTTRETLDLGLRLWNMGVRFRYEPSAMVRQIYGKSSKDLGRDAESFGRNEVLLYRKHPGYRPYSPLAALAKGAVARRWMRQLIARMPVSPEPALRAPFWLLEKAARFDRIRSWGVRLLQIRMGIAMVRGAVRVAGSWAALRDDLWKKLPVLLYHRVGPVEAGAYPELSVSARQFESHMRWLKRCGYSAVSPSDWLAWLHHRKALPRKPLLITFDDAYSDISRQALPMLRTAGLRAAVFVVTGQLGGTNAWDTARGSAPLGLMTAEEILAWDRCGIEFGTHSRTHPDLRDLADGELATEIAGSGQDLSRVLDRPAVSFAYPYGSYDAKVTAAVRNAFGAAFTCQEGLNEIGTDPVLLRRTMVQRSDSILDFLLRVQFGFSLIQRIRGRLRLRTSLRTMLASVQRHGISSAM